MHALFTCLMLASTALASPAAIDLELRIEDGRGKLLVDLQPTSSPCASDHGAEYVFIAHGSPYRLDLTCQDGQVELQLEEYQYEGPSLTGIQVTNKRISELPSRAVHGASRPLPPRRQVVVVIRSATPAPAD